MEFDVPAGHVKMALGKGHQGIMDTAYGTYRFNKQTKKPEIVDIVRYPAECVNPPAGINADDWIKDGMKGAKCK
jgi:branched-chain amino acid transport system substrate-binding protein